MKYATISGIDVSKLTFDVANLEQDHFKLTNDLDGFRTLFPYGIHYTIEHQTVYGHAVMKMTKKPRS